MSQNEFTKENKNIGLPAQAILDVGLNVFALDLLIESYTEIVGKGTETVEFPYKGVIIKLQISPEVL